MAPVYTDYPSMEQDNAHLDEVDIRGGGGGSATTPATITDRYFDSTNNDSGNRLNNSSNARKPIYKKAWFWLVVAGVVLVVGVVGTSVALLGSTSASSGQVGVDLPRPELQADQVNLNRNELGQFLLALYTERGMDWAPVGQLESFQGRALTFVAGSATYAGNTRSQNIERYALTVFYLSTYRQPHLLLPVASEWTSDQNWLSKESVCVWEGIVCNDDDSVQEILLPNHELSGSLPAELSLLLDLDTIDLTTNVIYMEDEHHFVWSILPTLVELSMDDNYFIADGGLPDQFRGLTSISKISLSYNLLQGSFDGSLFADLPTLTHLELESNYIEGPLPLELVELESLVYLYLRRNSLEINLDVLFSPGRLPSIFALWLDANLIGGSIPTTIGLYTDLASLSLTEADLTGELPTEMGQLVNMRRCWLYGNNLSGPVPPQLANWGQLQVLEIYGNDLTGSMPGPVCDAVGASEYEFRTLSADCEQVECDSCCTECF
jgi:hypothetical protein